MWGELLEKELQSNLAEQSRNNDLTLWGGENKLVEQRMNAYRAPSPLLLLLILPELCVWGLSWCLL